MTKFFTLALVFSLAACGHAKKDNNAKATGQDLTALIAKRNVYMPLARNQLDQYKFVSPPKCDSTKYTGYGVVVGMDEIDILKAESTTEPGRFYRHAEHDCYQPPAAGEPASGSDFSRDMALGLAHALWHRNQPDVAKRFMDYVDSHNGRMGDGDPFRTDLRPGLANTFHAIINLSDGVPLPPKVEDPNPEDDGSQQLTGSIDDYILPKGYEAELTVSHILLRGLIYGAISDFDVSILKKEADREPKNAFYEAVYHKFTDGDQSAALATLMDESLFPADRLPTSSEYCTDYLFQRDNTPKDWAPCPEEGVTHSGVDFLFATAVVTGTLRQAP